jgi:hypothetical protein
MLMVAICDDTLTQTLGPLTDFLYTPFPHLSQCHSALYNRQSSHLPVSVGVPSCYCPDVRVLLLFPDNVGEVKYS